MSADRPNPLSRARSPFERPEGEPPVVRTAHGWAMELRLVGEDSPVVYERVGGLVRVRGIAVLRHPGGDVEQPVEIVLAQDDASTLATAVLGEIGRFRRNDEPT